MWDYLMDMLTEVTGIGNILGSVYLVFMAWLGNNGFTYGDFGG
jgi:hypothetical protein